MAKSLRAKKSVKARAERRKKVFEPYEKERALRLAQKLGSVKETEEMEVDAASEEPKKKISTSGWKGSRNDAYKKKKAKKNKALKF